MNTLKSLHERRIEQGKVMEIPENDFWTRLKLEKREWKQIC